MGRRTYVSEEPPSRQAWRAVRSGVWEQAKTTAKILAAGTTAWFVPRWVIQVAAATASVIGLAVMAFCFTNSVREWFRIRKAVAKMQEDDLLRSVHDR